MIDWEFQMDELGVVFFEIMNARDEVQIVLKIPEFPRENDRLRENRTAVLRKSLKTTKNILRRFFAGFPEPWKETGLRFARKTILHMSP
jgi:hypothetical protein